MTTKKPLLAICGILALSLLLVFWKGQLELNETIIHFGTKWIADFWVIFLADLAAAFIAYSLWENHKQKQADEQENEIADKYIDKLEPVLDKYISQYASLKKQMTTSRKETFLTHVHAAITEAPNHDYFGFDLTRVKWGPQFYDGLRELNDGYRTLLSFLHNDDLGASAELISGKIALAEGLKSAVSSTKATLSKKRAAT